MLKSLELFGFKSFADRTTFEFSQGITCVVGPNGSGKSNVVDAIKWILGDQSPKSLRGKEMSDVIFNGSSGRKASGFAEATLVFDNRSALFPLDTEEVRVGRRLYQSGDSEYLLNGAAVRLKDIRELFMGTGAGTAAYSIIEQGRVDQILQGNPMTRRVVFEEAAGISKFKSRRIDAERKLEKVAHNLLRLSDIVDEVDAQRLATRNQAEKAAKYRDLSNELKKLWTGLAADDYRHLQQIMSEFTQADRQRQTEIEQREQTVQDIETEKQELDRALNKLDEDLRDKERNLASVRERIAAKESAIRYQNQRQEELETELVRLRQDRLRLHRQIKSLNAEMISTRQQLTDFENRVAKQRERLLQQESETSRLEEEIQAMRERAASQKRDREQLREEISRDEHRLTKIHSQMEALEISIGDCQERVIDLENILADKEREFAQHRRILEEKEAEQAKLQRELTDLKSRHDQLAASVRSIDETITRQRERRSAIVAQIQVLDDLEQRQEGISVGVQEILRRAHESPYPPWNEILGCVSDLLQVSLEQAPLLEVALGQRSQLIVVRSLSPILDYLNSEVAPISGRVGFLELGARIDLDQESRESSSRESARDVDLQGQPGVVCRADAMAEPVPEAAGLSAQLLFDTWVVRSLSHAQSLARDFPQCRFITEQGELIDSDRALYAGSIPNETALVTRRSELRQIRREILRLDRQIEAAIEQHTVCSMEREELAATIKQRELQAHRQMEAVADARGRFDTMQREVQRTQQELDTVREDIDRQTEQQQELQGSADEITQARDIRRQRIGELDAANRILDERTELLVEEVRTLRDDLKRQQLELAKHEQRLEGLNDVQNRLLKDQEQLQKRNQEADHRLREAIAAQSETILNILETRAQRDSEFVAVETLSQHVRALSLERTRQKQRLRELIQQEDGLHKERRKLLDEKHQAELEIRELRHRMDAITERIAEEYQVSLEELVASGASAYRDYLTEKFSDQTEPQQIASPEQEDELIHQDADPMSDGRDGMESCQVLEPAGSAVPVTFEEIRPEIESRVERLRRKLKKLGSINSDALDSLEELEGRYEHLSSQLADLQDAKATLEEIIRKINNESRRLFSETFESIRVHFQELFRKLFGGGEGDLVLEDPDDVLECGIDIVARPPGKELRSISLLSGGEKTMTAVALLFAMFKSKPSPYCVLDEVDAALDEANVDRYVAVVKEFAQQTQFVVITHRKRTMAAADVLYGVTMEQAGVSKRMSVRFEDVSDNGEIRGSHAA